MTTLRDEWNDFAASILPNLDVPRDTVHEIFMAGVNVGFLAAMEAIDYSSDPIAKLAEIQAEILAFLRTKRSKYHTLGIFDAYRSN